MKVWGFLPEFVEALQDQLEEDDKRWKDEWLKRTREGQEERVFARISEYYAIYLKDKSQGMPWLKVIGNCLIAWIREQHPEIWLK